MLYKKIATMLVVAFILSSCREKISDADEASVKQIKIKTIKEFTILPFEQLFDSCKVVPLETTKLSLIGTINRVWSYRSKYYILDRSTNSIFIFNDTGKFIKRIHDIGKDTGQYIGLMDFTIAENKIVAHSHRPYKLLYYDLDGKFEKEIRLSDYFQNIGFEGKNIVFISQTGKGLVYSMDFKNHDLRKYLPATKQSVLFEKFLSSDPMFVESKSGYISFPYSNKIYKFSGDTLKVAFNLDFGNANVPEKLLGGNSSATQIYKSAMTNNYGFFVGNFKETKDYIYFTYGKAIIVVYSKKHKTSTAFNFVSNRNGFINFENCFAHDGFDNQIMSVYAAPNFKSQMDVYRRDPAAWNKVPNILKNIDEQVSNTSNPLLVFYRFKKEE